jgi:hypothetical protein
MRARVALVAGFSATALAVSGLSGAAATASTPDAVPTVHSANAVSGAPTILDGLCGTSNDVTWAGDGFTAQDGAPTNPGLDTWSGKAVKCTKKSSKINTITVAGYPGQAMDIDFNIEFLRQQKGKPAEPDDAKKALCSYTAQSGTYEATGPSGAQWTIDLNKACTIKKKVGKKGVWVAVQASLDQAFGQWFHATQTEADVTEGDWRDTQNLFGLGCVNFSAAPSGDGRLMQECIFGGPVGQPDYILVLS